MSGVNRWAGSPDQWDERVDEFTALSLGLYQCLETLQQQLYPDPGYSSGNCRDFSRTPCSNQIRDYSPSLDSSFGLNPSLETVAHQNMECYRGVPQHLRGAGEFVNVGGSNTTMLQPYTTSQTHLHPTSQGDLNSFPNHGSAIRVTNQPRSTSINRGGSLRREAPADKVCEHCGACFTRNERLRYHIQRVHLQLDPAFECDVAGCQRAFRQRSDLLRHQRTVHRSLFPSPK